MMTHAKTDSLSKAAFQEMDGQAVTSKAGYISPEKDVTKMPSRQKAEPKIEPLLIEFNFFHLRYYDDCHRANDEQAMRVQPNM